MKASKEENCPVYRQMGKHPRMIAVDLDDTLLIGCFPGAGSPMPNIITRMRLLKEKGCRIIIHTSRINPHYAEQREEQLETIRDALDKYGIPYDEIWTGEGKPLACCYVDDKAFPSLGALVNEINWKETVGSGTDAPCR